MVKVLENLSDNIAEHEDEFRIFNNLSRHENFPDFIGSFVELNQETNQDQLWLVMEVWQRSIYPISFNRITSTWVYIKERDIFAKEELRLVEL